MAEKKKKVDIADMIETILPDHIVFGAIKGFGSGVKGDVNDIKSAGGAGKVTKAVVPDKSVTRTVVGTAKGLKEDVDEVLGKKKKHGKGAKLL